MVKNYDDMLSRFHLILERHGRTDSRTDRRTELLYQYRASVCWRAIKIENYVDTIFDSACFWHHRWLSSHELLPPTKEEVNAFARVCLSVWLSVCLSVSKITQKRVHGACRQMSGLINFWARSGSWNRIYTGFLHFTGISEEFMEVFRWNLTSR